MKRDLIILARTIQRANELRNLYLDTTDRLGDLPWRRIMVRAWQPAGIHGVSNAVIWTDNASLSLLGASRGRRLAQALSAAQVGGNVERVGL